MSGLKLIYFNMKQIVGIKVLLLLVSILLLPIAFAQLSVVSYISYFEAILPLVLQVLFINVLIPDVKGQLIYERLSKMSDFKLYFNRYLSSLLITVVIIGVAFIEYYLLFFSKIDVYNFYDYGTAVYSQIGIVKVLLASMMSVIILSTLQLTLTMITNNKSSSLFLTIIFAVVNMVFIGFPLNYLSLFFKGDDWFLTKIIWMAIIVALNCMILMKYKLTSYIVKVG